MKKLLKRISAITAFFIGAAIIIAIAAVTAFAHFNNPPYMPDITAVQFEVHSGESARSVGRRLEEEGLIRNRFLWNMLSRFSNEHIKTGNYLIEAPATQMAIRQVLVSGRQILTRVTIPEGFTINRIAMLMDDAGICSFDDFISAAKNPDTAARYRIPGQSMEGYLFPDTYLFPSGFPAERVVETLADTFFSRVEAINEHAVNMSPEELKRIVILASIVEREYRMPEEAPIMAGVFINRLQIGMSLQSCATVEYIITEIMGRPHPRVLTYADIAIRNPFNTYIHPGLPPHPISAPGAIALRAAMFPAETEYLYFRLLEEHSGRHYFSRTFDEHIRAGQLFVRGRP